MESLAAKDRNDTQKKADLQRQIAALQAQLGELPDTDPGPSSPKRRKLDTSAVLAPATPSPKKPRRSSTTTTSHKPIRNPNFTAASTSSASAKKLPENSVPDRPGPSTLLSKLAGASRRLVDEVEAEPLVRSSAFTDAPQIASASESSGVKRDERLAIIETLEAGPVDHKPPFDDPYFQQLEPNSGIRLSSRVVPHEDLQDHLRGRYYLSPSRLYSAVRLLPDKQGYDVPVAGDWITIAVVAERGPFKYTKAPVPIAPDEDDEKGSKGKGKETPKPSGKKFINLKLVDFGARTASSATGGKAVVRGDAMLSLLLFESDGFETVPQDEGRPKKVYSGGSRGAFEEMCDVKEGDVVALLNPRILKPFQQSNNAPHPTTNILAITPESASSILTIGRAKDLGLCVAVKRDGRVCRAWCDTRVSDVCDWHVQHAIEHKRASRPEFSAGTSGMSTTARKRKAEYDPRRKWGLKPLQESDGATYVVSGHIVNGGRVDPRDSLFVSENIGREGQAKKAARLLAARDDARILKALQKRDAQGMKPVMLARAHGEKEKEESRSNKGSSGGSKSKDKPSSKATTDADTNKPIASKAPFSAQAIRHIGFDPTLKPGQHRRDNALSKKRMEDLASIQANRKEPKLGPRPGEKVRSGVIVPPALLQSRRASENVPDPQSVVPEADVKMVDLDDF